MDFVKPKPQGRTFEMTLLSPAPRNTPEEVTENDISE